MICVDSRQQATGFVSAARPVLLGIDAGTSCVKSTAFDRVTGEVHAVAKAEYGIDHPRAGWAEVDPHRWWQALSESLHGLWRAGIRRDAVEAVGIGGLCPSLVVLDNDMHPLGPAILYADDRSAREIRWADSVLRERGLVARTGNRVAAGVASVVSLLWLRHQRPEVFRAVRHVVHASGYLGGRLTGELCWDPTNASLTGLYNLAVAAWDDELAEALEIDRSLFPDLREPSERLGTVSTHSAAATGLPVGCPVAVGAADTACAALGLACSDPAIVALSSGTTEVMWIESDQPMFDDRLINRRSIRTAHWLLQAAMSNAGLALQWLSRVLETAQAQLMAEADAMTDAPTSVLFVPYLVPERSPFWNSACGASFARAEVTTSRGELTKAVMTAVALHMADNLDVLTQATGYRPSAVLPPAEAHRAARGTRSAPTSGACRFEC